MSNDPVNCSSPTYFKLPVWYWNDPVSAINELPRSTNLIPPADTKIFPPSFDRDVNGSPGMSLAMLIEPEDTYNSPNGNSTVPKLEPLGIDGTIAPDITIPLAVNGKL